MITLNDKNKLQENIKKHEMNDELDILYLEFIEMGKTDLLSWQDIDFDGL